MRESFQSSSRASKPRELRQIINELNLAIVRCLKRGTSLVSKVHVKCFTQSLHAYFKSLGVRGILSLFDLHKQLNLIEEVDLSEKEIKRITLMRASLRKAKHQIFTSRGVSQTLEASSILTLEVHSDIFRR